MCKKKNVIEVKEDLEIFPRIILEIIVSPDGFGIDMLFGDQIERFTKTYPEKINIDRESMNAFAGRMLQQVKNTTGNLPHFLMVLNTDDEVKLNKDN